MSDKEYKDKLKKISDAAETNNPDRVKIKSIAETKLGILVATDLGLYTLESNELVPLSISYKVD